MQCDASGPMEPGFHILGWAPDKTQRIIADVKAEVLNVTNRRVVNYEYCVGGSTDN